MAKRRQMLVSVIAEFGHGDLIHGHWPKTGCRDTHALFLVYNAFDSMAQLLVARF
jgi:hypothetical protein